MSAIELPPDAIHPPTVEEWRNWLEKNHERTKGVWLVSSKKATGEPRFDYDAAVTEALAFGWVDSLPRKLDERRSMLWFAPRKAGTGWSRPNKERIERLFKEGRMHPAGLAKVEAAKQDRSWTKLDGVENLETPEDLQERFKIHPGSAENWESFPRSAKRGILEWILQAKRPETRANRIEETARLAAKGERANSWRPR